jgi:hypothetical protein
MTPSDRLMSTLTVLTLPGRTPGVDRFPLLPRALTTMTTIPMSMFNAGHPPPTGAQIRSMKQAWRPTVERKQLGLRRDNEA